MVADRISVGCLSYEEKRDESFSQSAAYLLGLAVAPLLIELKRNVQSIERE